MIPEEIISFLLKLISDKFTGRIIFDFHNGNISKKVKREFVEIIE